MKIHSKQNQYFLYLSSLFAFLAIICTIVLPHGILGVSRIDHLFLFISGIFFIFLGGAIFDIKLILPYLLLGIGFLIPIFYHFNQYSYMALRELIPLMGGSYIISWHFKYNNFPRFFYYLFCSLIGVGIIFCLIQNITHENFWLTTIYEKELLEKYLVPLGKEEMTNLGYGFGLQPEILGWSSLFLSSTVIITYLYKDVRLSLIIILLFFSCIGIILSGWRAIWLTYFISLLIINFIRKKFEPITIWAFITFLFCYVFSSVIVNYTNLISKESILVKGSQDRFIFYENKMNKTHGNKINNAHENEYVLRNMYNSPSVQVRIWHWSYFLPLLKNNGIFGSGPESYYKKTTYSYVEKNHPYMITGSSKKAYWNYNPCSAVIKVGIEYGLWSLCFIFTALLIVLRKLFLIFKNKLEFDYLLFLSIVVFTSALCVALTRTYQFNSLIWFSLAFFLGCVYRIENKNV